MGNEIRASISKMERPLASLQNLGSALLLITETIDEPGASAVNEIVQAMMEKLAEINEQYSFLFRLHHPNRERFEREGWPDDKSAEVPA